MKKNMLKLVMVALLLFLFGFQLVSPAFATVIPPSIERCVTSGGGGSGFSPPGSGNIAPRR